MRPPGEGVADGRRGLECQIALRGRQRLHVREGFLVSSSPIESSGRQVSLEVIQSPSILFFFFSF